MGRGLGRPATIGAVDQMIAGRGGAVRAAARRASGGGPSTVLGIPGVGQPSARWSVVIRPHLYAELVRQVAELADRGRPVPCRCEPQAWTGDDTSEEERERAAHLCRTRCAALGLCDQYAAKAQVRWGVWGGRDRTPSAVERADWAPDGEAAAVA